jgi:hypothetical protein
MFTPKVGPANLDDEHEVGIICNESRWKTNLNDPVWTQRMLKQSATHSGVHSTQGIIQKLHHGTTVAAAS